MGILAILLLLANLPKTILAQSYIPIEIQLKAAYHSMSYQEFINPTTLSTQSDFFASIKPPTTPQPILKQTSGLAFNPTPTPEPQTAVLGASTQDKIIKIAMLGDSMTDTLGPDFPKLTEALYRYYPSGVTFRFLNYGKGSDTIEGGAQRLVESYDYKDQKVASLISQEPDVVIVESFAYNNFGNTQAGFDRHWLNLGGILTTIKAKLPDTKILISSTIAPNAVVFASGAPGTNFSAVERLEKTQTIKYYLQRTMEFATSEGYPSANIYNASLVGPNGDRLYINANDGIHPSAQGAELIANILAKSIFDNHLVDTFN